MLRLSFVLAIVGVVLAAPGAATAKGGSYTHKGPEPVKAASVVPALPSLPAVSPNEMFNGCGGRRVRDASGQCRGPADFGH